MSNEPARESSTPSHTPATRPSLFGAEEERLGYGQIFLYSLPSLGLGYTFFLTTVYLLKYSTDVLLVAPGVMGLLFGLSRIWDAISDPVAGHLSDRTRTRLGRRRSWLLASALPIAVSFYMLWSPPIRFEGTALAIWMGVAVFSFFTATTMFAVPQEALGAELSTNYHDRTRIYGVKTAVQTTGMLLAAGLGMTLLIRSEDPRSTAFWMTICVGLLAIAFIVIGVAGVRERPSYQGRGAPSLGTAFRDVLSNPHARLLVVVFGIESFGGATIGVLVAYVMQYIVGAKELTPVFILLYIVPIILFVPVWIHLSRRFGKKKLWVFAMGALTFAFSGLFFLGEGDVGLVCVLGLIAGIGGGCGQVMAPSIQADVIDYDEYCTGHRKEGAYFAVWNFVRKSAFGLSAMLTGFVLELSGFEPNAEQSEATKTAMLALIGLVPGTSYAIGCLLFLRFRLNEAEHAEIRAHLDARNKPKGAAGTEA
jgi:GPH family glycoside/pentoside/hexuronide:cation symporter